MASGKSELRVAKRLDEVGFSDIVKARNRVMELRASGITVHGFHGGEPFFETPDTVKYAMIRALVGDKTKYAPSSGIDALRQALAHKLTARNHIPSTPDDVLVTSGGAHALYAAFQAVLDPGDDVLLFSPFWTPIREMINGAQARPLLVPTRSARRHGLTETLEKMASPHVRAIYYNTPQNPTGTVFTREEAEEVAAFARKRNLVVIADEAYEDLVYDGEHFSIASLPGMAERTISTYTFSKSYGMTGWRIGYLTAQEPFMGALRKLVLYSVNGVSTPTQWAALEALAQPEEQFALRRSQYRERRDLMVNGLNHLGLECEMPQGAFYAFPRAQSIHKESRKAAEILLEEAHIATVPGTVFGAQGEGHLRFGYATSLEAIREGLEALGKFLKK